MQIVKSRDNHLVKFIKKLKKKKYRDSENLFVVEGFRFVSEALNSSFSVPYVFIQENEGNKEKKYHISDLLQEETKVFVVDDVIMKDIASTENPQGIVAVVQKKHIKPEEKDGFYVLTDKIQDPGNMGTIIRTAHAAGALGVLTTKGCVDVYNEKTLRSTMGAIFKIPVIEESESDYLNTLIENDFKLVGSFLNESNSYYDLDLSGNIILAIGNEGNGISKEIEDICHIRAKIPMAEDAESLNAAVSAGIMIYELYRQRIYK